MDTSNAKAPPWKKLVMYKRNNIQYNMLLENNTIQHIATSDEVTLHEYRNRIHIYETTLDVSKNWEYYKKIVNPYELVYTQKKYDNFPESICFLKPLSRSYFKMVEMLDLLQFFDTFKNEKIRTAHVCEGPGGFIEAVYDRAFFNRVNIHSCNAMTLKSKQTNIPGWKRATNFLQKNRSIKILYGDDDTGDILKPENQQHFIDACQQKVQLFTADGGFDFSVDYSKQEEMILPLLIASTKLGFEVLKKGGVFILKIFDFYHKGTSDLLYFLSSFFTEWALYKPATSRPCNPEQYFIGKGFTGCSEEVLDVLRLYLHKMSTTNIQSLFGGEYNDTFNGILETLRKNSFKIQTEYLERVFFIIDRNNDKIIESCLRRNERISYEWCKRFNVPVHRSRLIAV